MPLLDRLTIFFLLFYAALRPLGTGLDFAEPETLFLTVVANLVLVGALVGSLRDGTLILPRRGFAAALAVFAVFAGYAVYAANDANWQSALDLGWNWVADGEIFWAALIVCRRYPDTRRLLLAALLAAAALAALYGLYQRYFFNDYVRSAFLGADSALSSSEGFVIRVMSNRIAGPYAYSNAYAGFFIILLPLAAPLFLAGGRKFSAAKLLPALGLAAALLAFVYAGSKAGFITAKITEAAALFLLMPPDKRRWWRFGEIAGWLTLTTGVSAGLAFGAGKIFDHNLWAPSVFAVSWFAEILLLGGWARTAAGSRIRAGIGIAVVGVALLALGAAVARSPRLQETIIKQVSVRGNYWLTALDMLKARPLTGYGLDNFGSYYGAFKQPDGWETRRVHNLYLQLAVDGGVGFLAALVALWAVFFRSAAGKKREANGVPPRLLFSVASPNGTGELPKPPTAFLSAAYLPLASGAALALTYLMYAAGAFTGLGIETFVAEWRQGWTTALVVNGAVNLLLLPLTLVLAGYGLTKILPDADRFKGWLLLGLAAAFFHFIFDFHYYHSVIGATVWLMAALALTINGGAWEIKLSPRAANRLLAAALVGFAALLSLAAIPRFNAGVSRYWAEKTALYNYSPAEAKLIVEWTDEALGARPRDATLWVNRGNAFLRLGNLPEALDCAANAVVADPRAAGNKIYLAQLLGLSPQLTAAQKRQTQNLYRAAIADYPLKPRYRALYASFLQKFGVKDAEKSAPEWAASALALDAATTDIAAKLSARDREMAEAINNSQ
ncbi:MAG: O-antigen ligase family protein [Planctomycetota bacterium]|nr:O-antigen ligase family protein [Planctomycetota bacterium]